MPLAALNYKQNCIQTFQIYILYIISHNKRHNRDVLHGLRTMCMYQEIYRWRNYQEIHPKSVMNIVGLRENTGSGSVFRSTNNDKTNSYLVMMRKCSSWNSTSFILIIFSTYALVVSYKKRFKNKQEWSQIELPTRKLCGSIIYVLLVFPLGKMLPKY